jgi:hypothetical protein
MVADFCGDNDILIGEDTRSANVFAFDEMAETNQPTN